MQTGEECAEKINKKTAVPKCLFGRAADDIKSNKELRSTPYQKMLRNVWKPAWARQCILSGRKIKTSSSEGGGVN
ncbi:MAG: hypothetical protein E7E83_22075, partial [Enterobacter ludwigii]|nr:hypothetical protein [Enterobacter ludwigii]